jgi:hypothetical protein
MEQTQRWVELLQVETVSASLATQPTKDKETDSSMIALSSTVSC